MRIAGSTKSLRTNELQLLVRSVSDPVTVIEGSVKTLGAHWDQLNEDLQLSLLSAAYRATEEISRLTSVPLRDEPSQKLSHCLRNSLVSVGIPLKIVLDEWCGMNEEDKRDWIEWGAREAHRMHSSFLDARAEGLGDSIAISQEAPGRGRSVRSTS